MLVAAVLEGVTVRPQKFGAYADGVHNDTSAILQSIAHCESLGGCTLLFDKNGVFLTGPFHLPSHSTIQVDGIVRAMRISDWKISGWNNAAFIGGDALRDVRITGAGTLDGNGEGWWNVTRDDTHYRPHLLRLNNGQGISIEGPLMFLDAANHNIMLENCTRVRVTNLNVHAPSSSPNTDGINFAGGSDQLLDGAHISNGDDCVSIVTVPGGEGTGMGYGGNVIVRNVTCVNGHGLSIGSVRHGTVRNVTVEHIQFFRSENGARIKTYPNSTGLIADIVYRDVSLTDVGMPILIDGSYCPKSQKPYPCPSGHVAVQIENVVFERVQGTSSSKTGVVGKFDCSPLSPCKGITLRDVNLTLSTGALTPRLACDFASGPVTEGVSPPSCLNLSFGIQVGAASDRDNQEAGCTGPAGCCRVGETCHSPGESGCCQGREGCGVDKVCWCDGGADHPTCHACGNLRAPCTGTGDCCDGYTCGGAKCCVGSGGVGCRTSADCCGDMECVRHFNAFVCR